MKHHTKFNLALNPHQIKAAKAEAARLLRTFKRIDPESRARLEKIAARGYCIEGRDIVGLCGPFGKRLKDLDFALF